MKQFKASTQIYSGQGSLSFLKELTGTTAFLVCDQIMEELGYAQQAVSYLQEAGINSIIFTGVRPDPDTAVVAEGLKEYRKQDVDILIALGGGSAIDTAKGILYTAFHMLRSQWNITQKPQFIAIPSTSGTGSEVTNFTVITAENEKICLVDDFIAPDIAILDSTCIQHVPKHVVADTGIDVLVHALEAYVSINADDFTDALAEKVISTLFQYLPATYEDSQDSFSRDKVQNASCMAGLAFTNTGLGITHSMAHAFGGNFKISHGRSNAVLLIPVMEYNAGLAGKANERVMKKYAQLADCLGLPARTAREGTAQLINTIHTLITELGIPESICGLKIDENEYDAKLEQMAKTALQDRCTVTNPVPPTQEDLIQIYQRAYKK